MGNGYLYLGLGTELVCGAGAAVAGWTARSPSSSSCRSKRSRGSRGMVNTAGPIKSAQSYTLSNLINRSLPLKLPGSVISRTSLVCTYRPSRKIHIAAASTDLYNPMFTASRSMENPKKRFSEVFCTKQLVSLETYILWTAGDHPRRILCYVLKTRLLMCQLKKKCSSKL